MSARCERKAAEAAALREELRAAMRRHAPTGGSPVLDRALREATAQTGRLVRGLLATQTARAVGMAAEASLQLGCAMEWWHLASLILDDLPCMDDADFRRGRPSLHRQCGESAALLAALALLNRAYYLVGVAFHEAAPEARQRALAQVDRLLGPDGLVGGQSLDLRPGPAGADGRESTRIAWRKTGTLLWLTLSLPTTGRITNAERRGLHAIAVYWGVSYQLIDDLHDAPAGGARPAEGAAGETRERANAVAALGVAATHERLGGLLARAERRLAKLAQLDRRWSYLEDWQRYLFTAVPEVHCAA